MDTVSKQYREAMAARLRDRSYMRITMGVVNYDAQDKGVPTFAPTTFFSNNQVIGANDNNSTYAGFDACTVDGGLTLLPTDGIYLNTGLVGSGIVSSTAYTMRFDFPEAMDIKGITLRFDSVAYPTAFTIATDNGVSSYTNDGVEWVTDDAFSGVTYLLFTFQTMSKDTARFRLKSMLFGYGLTYSNDDIITSEWKTYVSEISEDMPQVDFTVTLKNYDQYFDPDNPMSVINYLDTNMPMEIYYGMTLADQSIEWFRAAKVYVSEWSADNRKAVITATDVFRTMDEIFNKGQYRPDGISLYDLAVEVMEDAGFEEYYIDPYLANLKTKNPLPRVTHKEALQIIANAGRCVLSVDRAGLPEITSSFVPEIELAVNEEASWSQYANIAEDTTKERLTTFASDFMLAKDDNLYLQTETGSRAGTYGFISKGVSGADGTFLEPPTIIVTQETAVQRVGLTLKFGTCVPKTILIQTYTNGVSVENVTITDVSRTMYIPRAFKAFDTMNIRFTETQKPYQLAEVDYLHFEKASEFNLTQDDMLSYPISTNERSVKRIDTIASYYNSTNIVDSLFSEDVTVTANQVMEFYVNEASYDYAPVLKYPDQKEDEESPTQCTVVASGAYFVQVKFPEAGTFKLEMTGKRYNITSQKYSQAVQQRGDVKTWENPLISDISDAKDLTEWLAAYYANNIIYEYDTRGNPELDPNDIVYQESKYVENMKVRIAEQIVRFDGALHGKLVTRRTD